MPSKNFYAFALGDQRTGDPRRLKFFAGIFHSYRSASIGFSIAARRAG
jgi:hypothetical protein